MGVSFCVEDLGVDMQMQLALFDQWPAKRYRRTTRRCIDSRWRDAIHEASHAFVAHSLGIPFSYVTIRPSLGRVAGHIDVHAAAYLRAGPEPEMNRRVASLGMCLVAGEVGEKALSFTPFRCGNDNPGSDYEMLDALLGGDAVPYETKRDCIFQMERAVKQSLVSPAARIVIFTLATVLIHRTTIDHEQAVRVINGDVGQLLA